MLCLDKKIKENNILSSQYFTLINYMLHVDNKIKQKKSNSGKTIEKKTFTIINQHDKKMLLF